MANWNPVINDYDSFLKDPLTPIGGTMTSEAYRHAFSGADMFAFIGNRYIGNLVGLTISVTREVLPLYTFGDPSPRTFVKGKRGIAGTMAFTQFDKHAVLAAVLEDPGTQTIGTFWDQYGKLADGASGRRPYFNQAGITLSQNGASLAQGATPAGPAQMAQLAAKAVSSRQVHYVDQLPPFDLTLTMVNEYGAFAWLAIVGVQFVNEGIGYTLDNLASEVAVTYVARGVRALSNKIPSAGV